MPRNSKLAPSATLLEAALEGLQLQRSRIDEQIAEVRRLLGQRSASPATRGSRPDNGTAAVSRRRRPLSAAARKRIAAAQKRRWAEYRKRGVGSEERGGKVSATAKKAALAKKAAAG